MSRWENGVLDLLAGRDTLERREVLHIARYSGVVIILFAVLYLIGGFIPVGFDWKCCFSTGYLGSFFVPWMYPIVRLFNPQSLFAVTVLGIGLRMWRYKASAWRIGLALISLPTLWLLFLGNIDGLVLIGLLLLPVIGVPLVLLKPQIAAFALLANRRSIAATAVWIVVSIAIWGWWPLNFLPVGNAQWRADWPQDITLYPWGLIIALPLLWLSRGDEDMLMAAGSLATPHLFPYHFAVLMPALARMSLFWALLSWVISFTPFLSNWFGPAAWHFGNLLSLTLWSGLYLNQRSKHSSLTREMKPMNPPEAFDTLPRKVVVVMPAYNAEKTLKITYDDLPHGEVGEIILVDDASRDETVRVAKELGLTVYVHSRNFGYGGNQKTCYAEALRAGATIVVMVHPDYQYDPRLLPEMIKPIEESQADVMFGSRMLGVSAYRQGMPWWKYLANKFLTGLENRTFGLHLSEFHTGYRAYRREVLESINFRANSDNFIFDQEIVAQVVESGYRIAEIPVPVRYFPEASSAGLLASIHYGLSILALLLRYTLHRLGWLKSQQFVSFRERYHKA